PLPAVARRGDAALSGCGAAAGRSVEGHHRPRPPAHARPRPRDGAQRRARPGARIAVANAEHAGKPARCPARTDAARRQRSAADDARLAAIDAAPAAAPRQELPGAAPAAGPTRTTRTTGAARPTGTARATGPAGPARPAPTGERRSGRDGAIRRDGRRSRRAGRLAPLARRADEPARR